MTGFLLLRIIRHLYRKLARADCSTAEEIRRFGTHEPASSLLMNLALGEDDLLLDVGSNVGWYGGIARKNGAKVVSIEPNPDLEADIHCAVGAKNGDGIFYLAERSNWSSLNNSQPCTRRVEIKVRTLDDIIDEVGKPTFIKMDIEGGEWDALRESKFIREMPRMMLELHPNIIGRFKAEVLMYQLKSYGYKCIAVDRMWDFEVFHGVDPIHEDGWEFVHALIHKNQPVVLHLWR